MRVCVCVTGEWYNAILPHTHTSHTFAAYTNQLKRHYQTTMATFTFPFSFSAAAAAAIVLRVVRDSLCAIFAAAPTTTTPTECYFARSFSVRPAQIAIHLFIRMYVCVQCMVWYVLSMGDDEGGHKHRKTQQICNSLMNAIRTIDRRFVHKSGNSLHFLRSERETEWGLRIAWLWMETLLIDSIEMRLQTNTNSFNSIRQKKLHKAQWDCGRTGAPTWMICIREAGCIHCCIL